MSCIEEGTEQIETGSANTNHLNDQMKELFETAERLEIKDNGGSYYEKQYITQPIYEYSEVVKTDIYKDLINLF